MHQEFIINVQFLLFGQALNVEIDVECQIFVIVIFLAVA